MLGGVHDYCLPVEAVYCHLLERDRSIPALLDDLRKKEFPLSSKFGPVPRGLDRPAPDDATARAMIARRFGLYLSRRGMA
jgi:hypothetical protein